MNVLPMLKIVFFISNAMICETLLPYQEAVVEFALGTKRESALDILERLFQGNGFGWREDQVEMIASQRIHAGESGTPPGCSAGHPTGAEPFLRDGKPDASRSQLRSQRTCGSLVAHRAWSHQGLSPEILYDRVRGPEKGRSSTTSSRSKARRIKLNLDLFRAGPLWAADWGSRRVRFAHGCDIVAPCGRYRLSTITNTSQPRTIGHPFATTGTRQKPVRNEGSSVRLSRRRKTAGCS